MNYGNIKLTNWIKRGDYYCLRYYSTDYPGPFKAVQIYRISRNLYVIDFYNHLMNLQEVFDNTYGKILRENKISSVKNIIDKFLCKTNKLQAFM